MLWQSQYKVAIRNDERDRTVKAYYMIKLLVMSYKIVFEQRPGVVSTWYCVSIYSQPTVISVHVAQFWPRTKHYPQSAILPGNLGSQSLFASTESHASGKIKNRSFRILRIGSDLLGSARLSRRFAFLAP